MKLKELLDKYGEVELTEEQEKEIKSKIKSKLKIKEEKVFKPEYDDTYWYLTDCGEVELSTWTDTEGDAMRYAVGNCFKTEKEAKFATEKLKVTVELKRFALKHNKEVIDWKDKNQEKWCILFNNGSKKLYIGGWSYLEHSPLCFTSEEIAKQAIEAIGADRVKKYYFEVEDEPHVGYKSRRNETSLL